MRGVYRHKVSEIYEIHYLGGVVRTTGDHSVFVRSRNGVRAVEAKDLKPGDVLVQLPLAMRGAWSKESGTPHTVRAHAFADPEGPSYLDIRRRDPASEEALNYALAHRGAMSQKAIAEEIGTHIQLRQRARFA